MKVSSLKQNKKIPKLKTQTWKNNFAQIKKGQWSSWHSLNLKNEYELRLNVTFQSGQVFHWKKNKTNQWNGVLGKKYFQLEQRNYGKEVFFRRWQPTLKDSPIIEADHKEDLKDLESFLNLKYSLKDFVATWGKSKAVGSTVFGNGKIELLSEKLIGLRLLKQEPEQCLISFLCSQNNNISRITQMINSFIKEYGEYLFTVEEEDCFAFPSLSRINQYASDKVLRENLKFGYRSKYVLSTCQLLDSIQNGTHEKENWKLIDLRNEKKREEIRRKLTFLPGIGNKVSDCISLFSLDQLDLIPVDVHVYNIGKKYMGRSLTGAKGSSLAENQIYDWFQKEFQSAAGWAHTFMFVMDLASFSKTDKKDKKKEEKEEITKKKSTNKDDKLDDVPKKKSTNKDDKLDDVPKKKSKKD